MKYSETVHGTFVSRTNRFSAQVLIGGQEETVHVKNTGRCRELLTEGADVVMEIASNPNRKTKYDLISAYKPSLGWVNIDSQAPNKVMYEWLQKQDYTYIKPEYTYGKSRVDFYMERENEHFLVEVKGCTLERDGVGYFPDAPTERGIKHLKELQGAISEGIHTAIAFVIPMPGVTKVLPNMETHPAFGEALAEAFQAGVEVWYMPCQVTEGTLEIVDHMKADGIY